MSHPLTAKLLKPLERTVRAGHPWIYRDALEPFDAAPGAVVTLLDRKGRFLARGLAESGPLGLRLLTTDDVPVDAELFGQRIDAALALRDSLVLDDTDAIRLLHGEGDRLPGVVLDRYGPHAVLKLDGAAIVAWRERLVPLLVERLLLRGLSTLIERSGRGEHKQVLVHLGQLPEGLVEVRENGMRLLADLVHGQKTGLFLDHRDSRRRVRELSRGRQVLNLYGYTGAFSVAAGLGGARQVVTVDSAKPAMRLAEQCWALNDLDPEFHEACAQDVRRFLEQDHRRYDLVIADPPSFAPRQKARPRALAAYRALHTGALRQITERGLYLAASCSSHVDRRDFEQTLLDGARQAGRRLRIVERWGAAADHPVLPDFAEGDYLTVSLAELSN